MRECCILHAFPRACANTCLFTSHSRARVWQVFDGRGLAPRLPLQLPRARMTGFRRSKDICARERSVLAGQHKENCPSQHATEYFFTSCILYFPSKTSARCTFFTFLHVFSRFSRFHVSHVIPPYMTFDKKRTEATNLGSVAGRAAKPLPAVIIACLRRRVNRSARDIRKCACLVWVILQRMLIYRQTLWPYS